MNNTIAAISTAQAPGGIGIVRISGENAIEIASKVFKSKNGTKLENMEGYRAVYGRVFDENGDIDEAIALVFRAPKSFTGENTVELSCHGGVYNLQKVLRTVINNGASPATAGEFTRRAFENGRITLTQAESVMDIISAQGDSALRAAMATRNGALFDRISTIKVSLVDTCAYLAAWSDFPDEDIEQLSTDNLRKSLIETRNELDSLILTYDNGKIIFHGIDTVIAGKPNVGKSTLMNLLSGYTRSIVTDIPGTTRDVVEETVKIGDYVLRISDTAGLRQTEDCVEMIGVSMSRQKIEQADLILYVFDSSNSEISEDIALLEKLKNRNIIAILNKNDLKTEIDKKQISKYVSEIVEISALDPKSVEKLRMALEKLFKTVNIDPSAGIIANERQRESAVKARDFVNEAIEALDSGMTLDAVNVSADCAVQSLLELTGERASEEVVNRVFERFCVGK